MPPRKIRDAVRARSAVDNQDVVATLIVNEYREQGGGTIDFLMMSAVARQKLFRFLDNKFDSEKYRNNVRELTGNSGGTTAGISRLPG